MDVTKDAAAGTVQVKVTIDTTQARSWKCRDAGQAEKMLPTWQGGASTPAAEKISAGDTSMIRDMANEFRKQRAS